MKRPRIFYYCASDSRPLGGIKQIYRHVDILNRNGLEAHVVHLAKGFRARWFENATAVMSLEDYESLHDPARDFTVLPETYPPEQVNRPIVSFPGKKVIFNQNVHYGFAALGRDPGAPVPYFDESVRAVLTVSDHNTQLLAFAFPRLRIIQVGIGVDDSRFTFRAPSTRSHRSRAV